MGHSVIVVRGPARPASSLLVGDLVRDDFRVLSRGPGDGPWDLPRLQQRFAEGGFNGLNIRFIHPAAFKSLDFLLGLEGLQYLEVTGRIRNDVAAFQLPELRELSLATRSPRPVPGFASSSLTFLGIDDRDGKDHIAALEGIQELAIWLWKGQNLAFLDDAELPLTTLRLEGRKQVAALDGIAGCRKLVEVQVREARIESLEPLSGLTALRSVRVLPGPTKGEACLDLSHLTGLQGLEELHLVRAGAIRSLRPLLDLPALRDVRLRDTEILDGDLSPLTALSARATVVRPDE